LAPLGEAAAAENSLARDFGVSSRVSLSAPHPVAQAIFIVHPPTPGRFVAGSAEPHEHWGVWGLSCELANLGGSQNKLAPARWPPDPAQQLVKPRTRQPRASHPVPIKTTAGVDRA
jgi:hypothetical protein